jgi:hypothetical protein
MVIPMSPADVADKLLALYGGSFPRARKWLIAAEMASELVAIEDRHRQLLADIEAMPVAYRSDERPVAVEMCNAAMMALGQLGTQVAEVRADLNTVMQHAALSAAFENVSRQARAGRTTEEIENAIQKCS